MINKSKDIRDSRDNKKKLLKDFNSIMESDINDEFKRLFLNRFVDSWINKKDNSYESNKYWSKSAIELKILKEQKNINNEKPNRNNINKRKENTKEDVIKFNNEHLVPKVFFEDLFIDAPKLDVTNEHKKVNERRMVKTLKFYNSLKNQDKFSGLERDTFHEIFFNEFFVVVTLTSKEHNDLKYRNQMPNEFYDNGNKWSRYKYLKKGDIEVYEVDFKRLIKYNEWNEMTFERLIELNGVKSKVIFDEYSPFTFSTAK